MERCVHCTESYDWIRPEDQAAAAGGTEHDNDPKKEGK
jgi:hypothetical protein